MTTASNQPPFQPYYNAAQFRLDIWTELKKHAAHRQRQEKAGQDTAELHTKITQCLDILEEVEAYFAFPGCRAVQQIRDLHEQGNHRGQARQTERILRLLTGEHYRRRDVSEIFHEDFDKPESEGLDLVEHAEASGWRPYFEVLMVDAGGEFESQEIRKSMLEMRRDSDEFVYDIVVVNSMEDAMIAIHLNHNIQSVIIRYDCPLQSQASLPILKAYAKHLEWNDTADESDSPTCWTLGTALKAIRPELDLFLITDDSLRNLGGHTGKEFRRIFYHLEDYLELHLTIIRGIDDRYETPFFHALRKYSHRPTGVFHAMPISRGKSILKSHWIRDMWDFYGENIFLAETSATTGGLDSLLQPIGPIKLAQEKTARAFGANRSFFVTNGTSTANKIVAQALLSPGDIALVSRDCHKSHHYALVLSGVQPVYMDPYPLSTYTMYGAVTLETIKKHLSDLKAAGRLDQVKMLLLTNCTFDGLVYNPEMVMLEVLAIKPDMIFVWDEAWFGFARSSPIYRQRTAMEAARRLEERFKDPSEAEKYGNPRVRVYATQSTHKTLTSFRQGSMIHVHDQDFGRLVHEAFEDAYMTHTSTSPNYQILASLDLGRRQVELEGYELLEQSVSLAMTLREQIQEDENLQKYFQVLKARDLVPEKHRPSGLESFYSPDTGYSNMERAWQSDEFVLDPTRVTLHIGMTGMDGDTLRKELMDSYDIQINKTSRNTVLFMLNIGATRGAIAYLLEVLTQIARDLEMQHEQESDQGRRLGASRVHNLTQELPPLPDFSSFHPRFLHPDGKTPEGNLRQAYYLGRNDADCDFLPLDGSVQEAIESERVVVSASFVTPYPPGFPVLVPGQIISQEILDYLRALDVKEIHGYNPEFGLRVFKEEILKS
ncbi:MAG: ornithine decarboxylase [Myxococcales bacterium]|nr:ornithine decarboxylase [Myxococcales bacterium]